MRLHKGLQRQHTVALGWQFLKLLAALSKTPTLSPQLPQPAFGPCHPFPSVHRGHLVRLCKLGRLLRLQQVPEGQAHRRTWLLPAGEPPLGRLERTAVHGAEMAGV